ncbi:uncharacterized protein LOC8286767 isoform X2 [Ricinus communis]|uniref:uncharacterized protein LOC8286767 isoform X2 n=1 Tax=Ricinus communis TaxID=3988 RepID=UPI00077235D6|nr:uncharacterized protein LOC8286767 isoform X2 [Ricinus communis]|eukprot:XP_015572277.1 uncharacterized protein LOC8286767 isoform X2 [Ricinus communis]
MNETSIAPWKPPTPKMKLAGEKHKDSYKLWVGFGYSLSRSNHGPLTLLLLAPFCCGMSKLPCQIRLLGLVCGGELEVRGCSKLGDWLTLEQLLRSKIMKLVLVVRFEEHALELPWFRMLFNILDCPKEDFCGCGDVLRHEEVTYRPTKKTLWK